MASGGRGSVVLTHKGEVFTWVAAPQAKATQQQPAAALTRVDALSPFTVSRVATSGQVLLASARVTGSLGLGLGLGLRFAPNRNRNPNPDQVLLAFVEAAITHVSPGSAPVCG